MDLKSMSMQELIELKRDVAKLICQKQERRTDIPKTVYIRKDYDQNSQWWWETQPPLPYDQILTYELKETK